MIKKEIRMNLREIKHRIKVLWILTSRYFKNTSLRTVSHSYEEYDSFWDDFWKKKEYFKTHYPFIKNEKLIIPQISPLEFKKEVIIKIISKKIKELDIKSVLEIGSGAGLNLLFLAPLFPDVKFFGIEPTESGVRVSTDFIKNPPKEFGSDLVEKSIDNIYIYKGSILNKDDLKELKNQSFDLIFTSAVLEQLNNFLDQAFENIFQFNSKYYLFYEEWLEANSKISCYKTLVESDYFRVSTSYLNKFPIDILQFEIPIIQPSWLSYGVVFGKKMFKYK
jgi:tRNA G46 methylase TrmB